MWLEIQEMLKNHFHLMIKSLKFITNFNTGIKQTPDDYRTWVTLL